MYSPGDPHGTLVYMCLLVTHQASLMHIHICLIILRLANHRGRVIHPILCIAMYRCIDCIAVSRCIVGVMLSQCVRRYGQIYIEYPMYRTLMYRRYSTIYNDTSQKTIHTKRYTHACAVLRRARSSHCSAGRQRREDVVSQWVCSLRRRCRVLTSDR